MNISCLSTDSRVVGIAAEHAAGLAVGALHAEAQLTPKPGLVDRRSGAAHRDMDLEMLAISADSLREPLRQCAEAAVTHPIGPELRTRLGVIGRSGEALMLAATGGVNTHRGALWALGLLVAGAAVSESICATVGFAAALARLPDLSTSADRLPSHGQLALIRHGAAGAVGEACQGFPHVMNCGLPSLRRARARGETGQNAALDALLAIMANLEDTCVLHRGGPTGLRFVRRTAGEVLRVGGAGSKAGRGHLEWFCREADSRGLSAGGSADLLAATLFLDSLPHVERC